MLKNHFLDLEKFMLSYVLWENSESVFLDNIQNEDSIIFERIIYYSTHFLKSICDPLKLPFNIAEMTFELFKKIIINHKSYFVNKFME